MAYSIPSTKVYQELQSSAGTTNTTPDLNGVCIGPCYNVVDYVAGSVTAYQLTSAGTLSNNTVSNTYNLPSSKPGQVVELTSVEVWFSNARIETLPAESVTATAGSNALVLSGTPTKDFTALTSAGTAVVAAGDEVNIAWTTPSPGTFKTTVLKVVDSTNLTTADDMPTGVGTDATIEIVQTHQDIQAQSSDLDTSTTLTAGTVTVKPTPTTSYGTLLTASVYIGYRALRTDLAGSILEVTSDTLEGTLGVASDKNPLALGVELALSNTTTSIYAVAVSSDDLAGHTQAQQLLEGSNSVYALAILSQDQAILTSYSTHATQMSTPDNAGWRIVFGNTAIPTTKTIGTGTELTPYTGASLVQASGNTGYLLQFSTGTFLTDGVVPGDTVEILSSTGNQTGTFVVQDVVSNQQLLLPNTLTADTNVSFYVDRTLSKTEQAQDVAAVSAEFSNKRFIHVQPDICGIDVGGVTKYLPGYYQCAALAGMVAGFPVQQGFTNISVAGISDLRNSNYYFTKDQLNIMAAAGTFLLVQAVQQGAPYVRHEMTTDTSVIEYNELLIVKNFDYLSYYYQSLVDPFIGQWNITPDTINTIRQKLVAGSELLKKQKLPRIGPPLLDYSIATLAQDATNKDSLNITLKASVVYPNNYDNLYLVI